MINTLFITHKNIASSLINIIADIFPGFSLNYTTIEINCSNNNQYYENKYKECVESYTKLCQKDCNHSLIITDLYGATPYNLAEKLALHTNSKLISGISLAMLLKLVNICQNIDTEQYSLDQVATILVETAQNAIVYKDFATLKSNLAYQITEVIL